MSFKELIVYKKGFSLAMEIFEVTKKFPKEERYSLTDSDSENSETLGWLDFAFACNYINEETKNDLTAKNQEIGKLLNYMMNNPDKFR